MRSVGQHDRVVDLVVEERDRVADADVVEGRVVVREPEIVRSHNMNLVQFLPDVEYGRHRPRLTLETPMPSPTMRAVQLTAWQSEPEVRDVPVPRPGPGELLLRVDAVGLCHSDLHVMDCAPGTLPYALPMTLGHEVAGTVVEVGDGVAASWLDRLAVVHGVWSCGTCHNCRRGQENHCLHLEGRVGCGLGKPGGLAEYVLVPSERQLVVADGIPASQARTARRRGAHGASRDPAAPRRDRRGQHRHGHRRGRPRPPRGPDPQADDGRSHRRR